MTLSSNGDSRMTTAAGLPENNLSAKASLGTFLIPSSYFT
jgi:hypothetical protein